jgi:hypothetical protein
MSIRRGLSCTKQKSSRDRKRATLFGNIQLEPISQCPMPPRAISEDLCWAIVRMSGVLAIEDVVAYSGVCRTKVYEILALHWKTGKVVREVDTRMLGRPRHLSSQDVTVSILSGISTPSYSA